MVNIRYVQRCRSVGGLNHGKLGRCCVSVDIGMGSLSTVRYPTKKLACGNEGSGNTSNSRTRIPVENISGPGRQASSALLRRLITRGPFQVSCLTPIDTRYHELLSLTCIPACECFPLRHRFERQPVYNLLTWIE